MNAILLECRRRLLLIAASVAMLACFAAMTAGCRTVSPVREVRSSYQPDISRLMLKNSKIVIFNADLGWYNKQAGTIEGVTVDTQHVVYHLSEINKIETVREYSIIPAIYVGVVVIFAGLYLLAAILTHFEFL